MAGPRVAHAGRRRRKARPRGEGPRDNAGPRGRSCGHHVEGGFAYGGPTGIVGPGKNLGAVTQMRYHAPIFMHDKFFFFFRVGLCPTRYLPFAGDVAAYRALDSVRTTLIAWTRVHAIIKSRRVSEKGGGQ